MGGSNQSLFLIGALLVGQGAIPGQGTAAIPLLALGLLLSWAALPGWTELILMWPDRVGGIAATCGEAFRPYAPVLGNLTGVSYWWGWVPTCGLTALLSASAIKQWYLPGVPVSALASAIVLLFVAINLLGVVWAGRVAVAIGSASALLAFTVRVGADAVGVGRLAPGVFVPSHVALPGCLWRGDERHGRPLSRRLCRAGVRSGRLSRRRDDRSEHERAAGDVRERGHGDAVLPRAAHRVAGHDWADGARRENSPCRSARHSRRGLALRERARRSGS